MGTNNATAESIDAAAKVIEDQPQRAAERANNKEVTLSNGIVLRINQVPPLLVRQASVHLPKPKPPTVMIESKGREEENPNDPYYLEQVEDWQNKVNDAAINILLGVGTSVVSVPEGMAEPADNSWHEMVEAAGMQVNVGTDAARYLSWLRFYALANTEDVELAMGRVATVTGVKEEDVAQAMSTFPGRAAGGADSGPGAEGDGGHGDQVPATDPRPSTGD